MLYVGYVLQWQNDLYAYTWCADVSAIIISVPSNPGVRKAGEAEGGKTDKDEDVGGGSLASPDNCYHR